MQDIIRNIKGTKDLLPDKSSLWLYIENYIHKNKPYVIGLNTQKSIDEKLINIRAACNALSLISDRNRYKKYWNRVIELEFFNMYSHALSNKFKI